MTKRERRVNYAAFEDRGQLEWAGYIKYEDIPETATVKGFLTYTRSWSGKWGVDGLADVQVAKGSNFNRYVMQAVAGEKFRPRRWS